MSPAAIHRLAGLLVLGLVLTSLPARVWLFGACPICGCIHEPVLVVHVGAAPADPTPGDDPSDDPPASPHGGHLNPDCAPPLPYGPTPTSPAGVAVLPAVGHLHPQSDPPAAPVPANSLIRPPRA
ncbi:MAG TPA: hypothetical protein VKE74_12795 [Gemmataceae bacterium]|nr:hypothetical protein [Gemmataceae bacterium]